MKYQITSRWDETKVLLEIEGDTFRDAILKADLSGADLRGAYLGKADLRWADLGGADLRGADLRVADLRGADLSVADLRVADLRGADLSVADLSGANLSVADLRGADLSVADLSGADLRGADLSDVRVNWESHDLLAEILRREAGDDAERRAFAGLILVSRDWCLRQFLALDHPQTAWAASVLRPYIHAQDLLPREMRAWLEAHPTPMPEPKGGVE